MYKLHKCISGIEIYIMNASKIPPKISPSGHYWIQNFGLQNKVGIFSGNESIKDRKQRLHIAAPQNWWQFFVFFFLFRNIQCRQNIYIYTRFVYAGKACELYKKKLVPGSEAERRKPCILAIFRTSLGGGGLFLWQMKINDSFNTLKLIL